MAKTLIDLKELAAAIQEMSEKHHVSQAYLEFDAHGRLLLSGVSSIGDAIQFTLFDAKTGKMAEITTTTRFVPKSNKIL